MNELQAEYQLLGLSPLANDEEVHAARRRVAFDVHPDRGGSTAAMAQVNGAFVAIMKARRTEKTNQGHDTVAADSASTSASSSASPSSATSRSSRRSSAPLSTDFPSFTIDVLPVEAFEYLLLAGQELGDIVDSDPPYLLETLLNVGPRDVWCRLEIVPDAGSSTISLMCESVPELGVSAESCRDLWVAAVNAMEEIARD